MMESERKPLWRSKKKHKPQVVVNEEEEREDRPVSQSEASASVSAEVPAADPDVEIERPQPSAPSLPQNELDSVSQKQLFRRLYLLLTAHVSLFAAVTALFVYVPHVRNIMRRNVFDKLLLTSYVSTPLLIVVVVYLLFPSLRRRFAVIGLCVISATMCWLLSYVLSVQDAKAMMISVASSDACSLSTLAASFIPHLNMTSRKSLAFSPLFMLTSNAVLHGIYTRSAQAVLPAIVTTSLMTHFAFNARSLARDQALDLKPNERSYALVQMYMNGGIYQSIKSLFRRQSYQSI